MLLTPKKVFQFHFISHLKARADPVATPEKKGFFGFVKNIGRKDSTPPPVQNPSEEYARYLEMAKQLDYSEERKHGFLYRAGL